MKELLSKTMTKAVSLRVKLEAGIASGDNWFTAK